MPPGATNLSAARVRASSESAPYLVPALRTRYVKAIEWWGLQLFDCSVPDGDGWQEWRVGSPACSRRQTTVA